jgi:hypothetical protein
MNDVNLGEERFYRTIMSKMALDAATACRKIDELVESGVDRDVAILQVICGIYYAVPPGPPRPDYIAPAKNLYIAVQHAKAHYTTLVKEAEADLIFLKQFLDKHLDGERNPWDEGLSINDAIVDISGR